jgi:predicted Zn-dependent protease with MMP-like domain
VRSRAEQFDELVDAAVARLERRWGQELAAVEFAVAEVPPSELPDWAGTPVPLGWLFPAVTAPAPVPPTRPPTRDHGEPLPPRIVLYRRPLEARAGDRRELEALVLDVLVEQVADLLRLEPEAVDPDYGFFED